jgi:hypothetical protein
MSDGPDGTTQARGFSAADRKLFLGVAAVLVVVFALVGSNVAANHAPKPHNVPVGIIGPAPVVHAVVEALDRAVPGAYRVHGYASLAAAEVAIRHRRVYAAYQPRPSRVLLIASAASPSVAQLLQQTVETATVGQSGRLVVRDIVPLPSSDSRGATAFSAVLSLLIASIIGSTVIFLLGGHRPLSHRLAAMITLGVGAGLATALMTNVIIAAFPGHFLGVWGVSTLLVLAIGCSIIAFQILVGAAGTAIGAVMFLVIGNPASGGSSAPELLPGFWRALSQILPPGAATTAMRDVVYFHGHGMTAALVVLAAYTILGITVAITVRVLRARATPAARPA